MLTLLALLAPQDEAQALQDRLAKFLRGVNTLSVEMRIQPGFGNTTPGPAKLVFERPRRTRFDIKAGKDDYSFSATERETIEVDRAKKIFSEEQGAIQIGFPPSKLSDVNTAAFPIILIGRSARDAVATEAKFSTGQSATINGVTADLLIASWDSQFGSGRADIYLDAQGKPVKMSWRSAMEGELSAATTEFFNYKVNQPIPISTFRLAIPAGFSPFTLQPVPVTPEFGTDLQLGTWQTNDGKKVSLDSVVTGKTLLFFSEPGCLPSNSLRRLLVEMQKNLGVKLLELSIGKPAGRSGLPTYWSPTEDTLARLKVPCTPTLFLLDSKGLLQSLWYGFDPARKTIIRKELEKTIKALQ